MASYLIPEPTLVSDLLDAHRLESTRRIHGREPPADEAEGAEEPSHAPHGGLPKAARPLTELGQHRVHEPSVMPFCVFDSLNLPTRVRPTE